MPVYKHTYRKERFFFEGVNGFWICSDTYGPTAGGWLFATWTKGAWTVHSGPKSIVFLGMNIEYMVPVFMKHSYFQEQTSTGPKGDNTDTDEEDDDYTDDEEDDQNTKKT